MTSQIQESVWKFLPSRPDRRRVTHPDVIAVNIGATPEQVAAALADLERAGRIVRDGKTGAREGWHRVTTAAEAPEPDGPDLFGASA